MIINNVSRQPALPFGSLSKKQIAAMRKALNHYMDNSTDEAAKNECKDLLLRIDVITERMKRRGCA